LVCCPKERFIRQKVPNQHKINLIQDIVKIFSCNKSLNNFEQKSCPRVRVRLDNVCMEVIIQ
jgi:hypothetical protein